VCTSGRNTLPVKPPGMRTAIPTRRHNGIPTIPNQALPSTGAEGIDIKHSENIIIADSATDFEKEIVNLLDNKSFFTKIGENARKFIIENMDNKKITAELADFYKANLR